MIKAFQNLTTAQQLLILSGLVGLFSTIAPLWLNGQIVATVSGALITFLGVLGTALTGQGSQLKEVSNFPGVDPIRINNNANSTVRSVAESGAAPKVLPPTVPVGPGP